MKKLVFVEMAVVLCLAGCRDSRDGELTLANLGDADAVVRVNGEDLTWGDLRRRLEYDYELFYIQNRSRTPDSTNALYMSYRAKRIGQMYSEMINACLVRQAAARDGVSARTNFVEEIGRRLIGVVAGVCHGQAVSNLNDVAAVLSTEADYVRRLVEADALNKSYFCSLDPRCAQLSDSELQVGRQRISEYERWSAASNKVHLARLEELKRRAEGGDDFERLGRENGQVRPHEGSFWEAYNWDEVQDEKLRDWAFSAKVGDIGGPFSLGDGYSIVKLLKKEEGARRLSAVSKAVARVYLARITLYAFDPYPKVSDDDLRRTMMDGYLQMVQKQFFEKSHAEMRIYYPNGTNLFSRLPSWFSNVPRGAAKQ